MTGVPPPTPPPSDPLREDLIRALTQNVDALKNVRRSLINYGTKLGGFFNPLEILGNAFKDAEQTQIKALQAGTTYSRFLESNTTSLEGLQSSNLSLTKFMMGGFTQGLRNVSRSTIELADEMIITGQDTKGLARNMGQLRLLTGNSSKVTASLSETILKTNRETGVTTGHLIDALGSFQQALFDASIYGETAVEGLAELGVALEGGLAGSRGGTQAINTLLSMQDSLNIADQELLGLRQLFDEVRSTGFDQERHLGMIVRANDRLQAKLGEDPIARSALSRAYNDKNVKALSIVANGITKFNGLTEEQKKEQSANLKSMAAFEERKKKAFDTFIPGMYKSIVTYLPQIAIAQAALGVTNAGLNLRSQGAAMMASARGAGAPTRAAASALRGGAFRKAIGTGLSFLGPVGMIAGLALSFGPELIGLLTDIRDDGEEHLDLAQAEERRRRAEESARNVQDQVLTMTQVATIANRAIQQSGLQGATAEFTKGVMLLNQNFEELLRRLNQTQPGDNGQQASMDATQGVRGN